MKSLFIIGSVFLFSATSCAKLDTKPSDFIAPQYSFNTEAELNASLTGVYDIIGQRTLYSGADGALNTVFNCTDEMFYNSTAISSNPRTYSYSATDAWADNIWAAVYRGVERANIVLANIDKPKLDENRRNIIRGEAKFLRAYYYFMLVQNFGAVPLRTTPTASVNDVYNERTSASEVYDFIYNEMVEAEGLVQPVTAYNYAERVTKSAVQGILARVSLFMAGYPNNITSKYTDALYWAEKVIGQGYHKLNPDYSQVFINLIQDKYDTKESIWEIGYYTTGAGELYTERGELGIIMGIRQTAAAYGVSSPQYQVQDTLYKRFDVADLRRDWCIAPFRYNSNVAPAKTYWTSAQIYDRFIGKYRREFELVSSKSNQNGTNNSLLRYADVLLMAAEAENELHGPTAKALGYINEVRRRAYGNGKAIKSVSVTSEGTGYTAATTSVSLSGGGGVNTGIEPASANAVVTGGKITAINIVYRGTLYSSTPVVTVTSTSGGTGAVATASLTPATDADLASDKVSSKESLRLAIQDERARELCFEGWRRLDLMRWGILVPTMKAVADYVTRTAPAAYKYVATAGNNIIDKYNYFPIPSWELSVNNKTYQNEDW